MSKDAASKVENVPAQPTVSVAEAMGLPNDWSLSESLSGKAGEKKAAAGEEAEDDDDDTPADTEDADDDDKSKGEDKSEGKSADEKKDGEKAAPEKKGEKKEEKPAKKTETPKGEKKGEKPTAEKKGEKAAAEKQEEKPAEKAAAKAPAKIKLGDKEYTAEELQAIVGKADKAVEKPAAVDTPKKELTKEEIAQQEEAIKKKDNEWISSTAKVLDAPLDETVLDKILTGGPEAVVALQQIRQQDMARAVLIARKSMFADLQPILDDLRSKTEPLVDAQYAAEDQREWDNYVETYPVMGKYREASEAVMAALVEHQADKVKSMSMEQFKAEVYSQTKAVLKKYGVNVDAEEAAMKLAAEEAAASKSAEGGEEKGGEEKTGGEKAAGGKKEEGKEARVKMKPPGANVPAPVAAKGGKGKGGDSEIIRSLW